LHAVFKAAQSSLMERLRKSRDRADRSNPVWAFLRESDPRIWLKYVGQMCQGCRESTCGACLGGASTSGPV